MNIFTDYNEFDQVGQELDAAIKALRAASNLIWEKRLDQNGEPREGFGYYTQVLDNAANETLKIKAKVKEVL